MTEDRLQETHVERPLADAQALGGIMQGIVSLGPRWLGASCESSQDSQAASSRETVLSCLMIRPV